MIKVKDSDGVHEFPYVVEYRGQSVYPGLLAVVTWEDVSECYILENYEDGLRELRKLCEYMQMDGCSINIFDVFRGQTGEARRPEFKVA